MRSSARHYLGIDAGGSGSRWALIDDASPDRGVDVAAGDSGPPIQVSELGVAGAAVRVTELLRQIGAETGIGNMVPAVPTVVGLAGVGVPGIRNELAAALAAAGYPVAVVEDTVTGAAAALADAAGVAVFAGTGSFGIARDADGRLHRVGGRGSIASDHGSGYRVVRAAADAAMLALDGIGLPTALEQALPKSFGVDSAALLSARLKTATARDIASHFAAVVRVAEAGDAVALQILQTAAADLTRLAGAAARRAGLDPATCPITLGGGTVRSAFYRTAIEAAMTLAGHGGDLRRLAARPERGAARLARAMANAEAPLCDWVATENYDG